MLAHLQTLALLLYTSVASEAYHDWSGEATSVRLRVNFTLKLLLSQNFCNRPLMRFISFASNIGPAATVPAGPAPAPLTCTAIVNQTFEDNNSVTVMSLPSLVQSVSGSKVHSTRTTVS